MKPKRIRLSRKKGWRKPDGAVVVARPTSWGNPFRIGAEAETPEQAVSMFRDMFGDQESWSDDYPISEVRHLRGKDLACWCALDQPCHADVLLEIANRGAE